MRSSNLYASVSLLIATSGMATDQQINLLVVQLRLVNFLLLFVKGGIISITIFSFYFTLMFATGGMISD